MGIVQRLLARFGIGVYRVLFIGKGTSADSLKRTLNKLKRRYKIVSTISDLNSASSQRLEKLIKRDHVDTVIVADSGSDDQKLTEILSFCQDNHVGYQYVPTMSGL